MEPRVMALAILLLLLPATLAADGTGPQPAAPCASTAGRDALTAAGYSSTFDAPGVTAPELSLTHDVTGDVVTPHRTAPFHFYLDSAPYEKADITVTLTWTEPSDYDLFLFEDVYGTEVARSVGSNIDEQTTSEQLTYTAYDCEPLRLHVTSWAGSPAQQLALEITVAPLGGALEDVTARPADTRKVLYLGGDRPGQATTVQDFVGTDIHPRMEEERPTNGDPNQITRPVVGYANYRNPFVPWWHADDYTNEHFPTLAGAASAVVWMSAPAQEQDPGEVLVQLYVNGGLHDEVAIPGGEVPPFATPFIVSFADIPEQPVFSVTLQVTPRPTVSTDDPEPNNVGDATHTVWYDSVQYPARLYLPIVPGESS